VDIRLFKFLVFLGVDGVLVVLYFIMSRFSHFIPKYELIRYSHVLLILTVPVLLLLPEDNWIWIVEENLRTKKISLRTKSVKHLHLSMLYIFLMNYPILLFCVALMQLYHAYDFPHTHGYIVTKALVTLAFLYGIYSAWKNYRNVREHESLFAVGWDRRALFFEIFVGLKVTREPYFFYSGLGLMAGLLLAASALLAPPLYLHYIGPLNAEFDQEKHVVITSIYHLLLVSGVWATTMYVVFQAFFSRPLERWGNESKDRSRNG